MQKATAKTFKARRNEEGKKQPQEDRGDTPPKENSPSGVTRQWLQQTGQCSICFIFTGAPHFQLFDLFHIITYQLPKRI